MKKKAYLIAMIALLATFGVMGGSIELIDTAEANSNGHSRHSGYSLAGRSFQIKGTYVSWDDSLGFGPKPADFTNCYTFVDDNTWIDPLFLDGFVIPGTWVQHTGGLVTSYTAFAEATDLIAPGIDLSLIQNGTVTPTFRRGKQRLNAYSTLIVGPGTVVGVVLSRGYSTDSCN
jgi:hypothetical protein